jgi:hypothetical protein
LLVGWNEDQREGVAPDGRKAKALIASLDSSGIITDRADFGKPFLENLSPPVEVALGQPAPTEASSVLTASALCFFLSCGFIDWSLRSQAISRTVARVARSRARLAANGVIHVECVERLVTTFKVLRPWYPRPYRCLFDSLALFEFLARHRFAPALTFGIVADPFEAHCWLQNGNMVLNDELERVRRFTPILSV